MNNNNIEMDHPALRKLSKIARDELRELNEQTREEALRQMRDWLKQNNDVKNVREDPSFLLRFLRTKKYSILMAQQQLLKYLNLRRVLRNYVTGLDFLSPNLQHLVSQGYMFVSPMRDSKGRRVIISTASNFDIDRCNSEDLVKMHFMTYETLVENEADQVLGVVHVGDFGSVGPKHVAMFNITDFLRIIKWGERSLPMRHKEIHIFNVFSAVKYIVDHAKGMVSDKIKKRLNVYVNTKDFVKSFDIKLLPAEMGGTIPMSTMIELWKQELAANRDRLLRLDEMEILDTSGIISSSGTKSDKRQNCDSVIGSSDLTGSFRKLEID